MWYSLAQPVLLFATHVKEFIRRDKAEIAAYIHSVSFRAVSPTCQHPVNLLGRQPPLNIYKELQLLLCGRRSAATWNGKCIFLKEKKHPNTSSYCDLTGENCIMQYDITSW